MANDYFGSPTNTGQNGAANYPPPGPGYTQQQGNYYGQYANTGQSDSVYYPPQPPDYTSPQNPYPRPPVNIGQTGYVNLPPQPPQPPHYSPPQNPYPGPPGQYANTGQTMTAQNPAQMPDYKSQSSGGGFFRFITNILFTFLIIAIVGGAALFTLSNDPQKSYFGYRLYSVKSPSMTPREDGSSPPGGFRAGDIILVRLCEPETVQVGDIITFVPGDDPTVYLTHRVVKVLDHLNEDQGLFFVTRGDANDADDSPIKADVVIGKKALSIPGSGLVLDYIRENLLISLIILLSGISFIILLRIYLAKPDKQ